MFHWVEARAFCHATEDEEKVVAAIRTLLPEGDVKRETLEGHFGNPLVSLVVRVDAAAAMKAFWRRLADALGKDELGRDLEARIDEDFVYHLRVDKGEAYLGRIARPAGDVIDVRAKVAAYVKKPAVAVRVVREFVEAL